jgi:hypothetical protein
MTSKAFDKHNEFECNLGYPKLQFGATDHDWMLLEARKRQCLARQDSRKHEYLVQKDIAQRQAIVREQTAIAARVDR